MHKRITGVFCFIAVLMVVLVYRIYYINAADYLAAAAAGQGSYKLTVATTRGLIYDRNMRILVGNSSRYIASVLPTPASAAALLEVTPEGERPALLERLQSGLPFAQEIPDSNLYAEGIDVFYIPQRYGDTQYAPHLVGYMGNDGLSGAAGIEKGFDAELTRAGGKITARYALDAMGRVMTAVPVEIDRSNETPYGGVVLTIDRDIQLLTQSALAAACDKGAAVVLDIESGDILAMASLPVFDQNNIAASLDSTDAPFVNRAVSGYNIGSVFKIVVASGAIEKEFSPLEKYTCNGWIDIGGQIFKCNNNAAHGECDMQRALNVSCNCYFIALGQQLGAENLLATCRNLGLGMTCDIAPGIAVQAGNLPTMQELENPAALANLSFGQGSSLATPLQMASVIAAIANGGNSRQPHLVRGLTTDTSGIMEPNDGFAANRAMTERTAETVQALMAGVVENGSGRTAAPKTGGAGGKTSSAQTGIQKNGKEIVHAWFGGFYPAEHPKYSIVVFVEGGESGEQAAAPVFKAIADGIAKISSKK